MLGAIFCQLWVIIWNGLPREERETSLTSSHSTLDWKRLYKNLLYLQGGGFQ